MAAALPGRKQDRPGRPRTRTGAPGLRPQQERPPHHPHPPRPAGLCSAASVQAGATEAPSWSPRSPPGVPGRPAGPPRPALGLALAGRPTGAICSSCLPVCWAGQGSPEFPEPHPWDGMRSNVHPPQAGCGLEKQKFLAALLSSPRGTGPGSWSQCSCPAACLSLLDMWTWTDSGGAAHSFAGKATFLVNLGLNKGLEEGGLRTSRLQSGGQEYPGPPGPCRPPGPRPPPLPEALSPLTAARSPPHQPPAASQPRIGLPTPQWGQHRPSPPILQSGGPGALTTVNGPRLARRLCLKHKQQDRTGCLGASPAV